MADSTGPGGPTGSNGQGWFDRPMRWAQLTLTEDDPAHLDTAFWLDYFDRTHSQGACLSAGGYVAYYPTDVPLHHRSVHLGDTDPFGDLVAGCRARGMAVLARTDPHAVHEPVRAAHPDWIAVGADGQPRRHWAMPDAWVACTLGPYGFEYMTRVHREIMTRYRVDGIFSNRWTGSGMCYCEHCRAGFAADSGLELPAESADPRDPARLAYRGWRECRLFELCRLWDAEVRAVNPQSRFIPNSGGGALSELDMKTLGELSDIVFADRQGRSGAVPAWAAGKNAKEYRATMGRKPVGGIFSVGMEGAHRWKDSTQSPEEIRIWVADGIANGMRPWFTKFSGAVRDGRWLAPVEELYGWHHRWEPYLRNEESLARVGVVYSQQTARVYGGAAARSTVEDHLLGVYHALVEARIPFEMVHDGLLAAAGPDRFDALVLPNIAVLSDSQCAALRAYVEGGGGLVATYETSLYDERGERRDGFGLGDLFGVAPTGPGQEDLRNSYLLLEDGGGPGGARHPVLAGLGGATRIVNGVRRVPVEPRYDGVVPALALVPPYPDLPMEEVYPRPGGPVHREAYLRELDRGRVAYFPWDLDRTFWEVLDRDHGRLLRNAVTWAAGAAGGQPPVTVTGPGLLDVTVWRQRRSLTVHLVNLTNPMALRGSFRELLPVGPQLVRLRLPAGAAVAGVRLARAEVPATATVQDGVAEVVVPTVLDHEMVAVDLA